MFAAAEAEDFRKFPDKFVKKGACAHFIRVASKSFVLWFVRSIVIHQGMPHGRMGNKHPAPPAIQVSFGTALVDVGK